MRLKLALACLILSGCNPADQKVKTVKERLESGELVEFTEPGYRRPSCNPKNQDWQDLRVTSEDERSRIILGKQQSAINPGSHSCYRIGTQLSVNSPEDKGKNGGLVTLTKLSLIKADNLQKQHLKGEVFSNSSNDEFFKLKDGIKFRLKPDHQGIITILEFSYQVGTALDEKSIQEKNAQDSTGDGFQETKNDGDTISECNKPWSDLFIAEEFHQAILSGKLKSFYNWGDRNCLAQGQKANIKPDGDKKNPSLPIIASVKVTKIKKIKARYIDAKYFVASTDYDLSPLLKHISTDAKSDYLTIVDFQVDGLSDGVEKECLPASQNLDAIKLTQAEEIGGKIRFSIMVNGKTCYRVGDLAMLTVIENGSAQQLVVSVLEQTYNKELGTTHLKVEIISRGEQ